MSDVIYEKAPQKVLDLAKSLIEQYHPHLLEARIGFLMRDPAQQRKGRIVLGTASKVTPKYQPLLDEPLDFLIILALDEWESASPQRRTAILDHELCHCGLNDSLAWSILPHDVEEFHAIIRRHGFWDTDLKGVEWSINAFRQGKLGLETEPAGGVYAVDPGNNGLPVLRKVLDSVADQVNDGILDSDGVQVTAEVSHGR